MLLNFLEQFNIEFFSILEILPTNSSYLFYLFCFFNLIFYPIFFCFSLFFVSNFGCLFNHSTTNFISLIYVALFVLFLAEIHSPFIRQVGYYFLPVMFKFIPVKTRKHSGSKLRAYYLFLMGTCFILGFLNLIGLLPYICVLTGQFIYIFYFTIIYFIVNLVLPRGTSSFIIPILIEAIAFFSKVLSIVIRLVANIVAGLFSYLIFFLRLLPAYYELTAEQVAFLRKALAEDRSYFIDTCFNSVWINCPDGSAYGTRDALEDLIQAVVDSEVLIVPDNIPQGTFRMEEILKWTLQKFFVGPQGANLRVAPSLATPPLRVATWEEMFADPQFVGICLVALALIGVTVYCGYHYFKKKPVSSPKKEEGEKITEAEHMKAADVPDVEVNSPKYTEVDYFYICKTLEEVPVFSLDGLINFLNNSNFPFSFLRACIASYVILGLIWDHWVWFKKNKSLSFLFIAAIIMVFFGLM